MLLVLLAVWIRRLPLQLLSANDRAVNGIRNELEAGVMRRFTGSAAARAQRSPDIAVFIDRWMEENRGQVETQTAAMTQRIRDDLTYQAPDGRSYPYLAGFDSYLWLRYARTRLRTGSACDGIVNGGCRDAHNSAPVGSISPYAQRLHVPAIAELHRIVTRFRPDYPLPATAFLLSVIVGALCVIPAFFLGRILGGGVGALFAGVFTAAHPAILARTMDGDNDVWNLALPLYAIWATVAALRSERPIHQAIFAALASVAIGLQAWAWSGWIFIYAVILAGCAGALLLGWRSNGVRRIGLVMVVFYVGSAICAGLAVSPREYFRLPAVVLGTLKHAVGGDPVRSLSGAIEWPNALDSVAELARMRLPEIVKDVGGGVVLLAAFAGLVITALPVRRRFQTDRLATACLLTVWMLAALYMAFQGVRFMLLLAPPLGLAAAAAIGSAARGAWHVAAGGSPWYRRTTYLALAVVVAIVVLQPVSLGYAVAREYAPEMNDAWWGALTNLREHAAPDAIVHTWWDYGDWVTYVAERRVDNDGTSLLTHVPVWVGKALAAPREQDSVGVLRMLGCGSDLTPAAGASQGAYGKLLALRRNPLDAYTMVTNLVALDRPGAEAYLEQRGIGAADRADILRSTHCAPPESYLVLSSKMVEKRRSWMGFGLWDPAITQNAAVVPFLPKWLPCKTDPAAAEMTCAIQTEVPSLPERFDRFVATAAGAPRLISRRGWTRLDGPPALLLRAEKDALRETRFADSPYPNLGVLVDSGNNRILIGAPDFLKSTFVHLMYLDGRYVMRYKKVDDRAAAGERVVTWKIE